MLHPRLLFVPLDDRPVCLEFVVALAQAAGIDVRTPDRALLGERHRPGDVDGLWSWLEGAISAGGASALIASAEMLCFGGLVASRKSEATFEEILPRLQRLEAAGRRLRSYVSAVLPRTPQQPTDEDAAHWHSGDVLARRRHRTRQVLMIETLIGASRRGAIHYLLVGQDDAAPGSDGTEDRARVESRAAVRESAGILLTTGADELAARLLARSLHDLTGLSPAVRTIYTYPQALDAIPRYEARPLHQTVEEQITSTGCRPASDAFDILLWVHNFDGRQAEARDQSTTPPAPTDRPRREVAAAVAEAQIAALADVRFANGADGALVATLLEEPRFAGVVAYGGWNTCSNTLGSTLAQAVVAFHLRAGTVAGSDRIYRPALFARLLEDWGYQAVVRPELAGWLAASGGNAGALGELEGAAEARAAERFRAGILPRLQASFRHHPTAVRSVTFPWHRLFEVRLDVLVTPFGRRGPGNLIVVEHDPAWAEHYERDRVAIAGALGKTLRGIEHIGSTAVPGLAAKPIVDILAGVVADDLDRIIEPLQRIGYEYSPDWEISQPHRRYFRRLRPDGASTHHLHAVEIGGEIWNRHLRFRDYLRAHPAAAGEYAALKRALAAQHRGSTDYAFAKTAFIRSVEARAGVVPTPRRGRGRGRSGRR